MQKNSGRLSMDWPNGKHRPGRKLSSMLSKRFRTFLSGWSSCIKNLQMRLLLSGFVEGLDSKFALQPKNAIPVSDNGSDGIPPLVWQLPRSDGEWPQDVQRKRPAPAPVEPPSRVCPGRFLAFSCFFVPATETSSLGESAYHKYL